MTEPASLIDPSKRIGTVTRATASFVEITLPSALAASGRRGMAKGSVGEFVFIDCDRAAILGRITEVGVPEHQRNALEHQIDNDPVVNPQGRIQLLATASKITQKVTRGISTQPRVGDGVFLAEGRALSSAIKDALTGDMDGDGDPLLIELGHLSGLDSATLSIPPEKLFGRHCGVFGATGGGKSWTVSRLVNETVRIGGKCILFDPTGEFKGKIAGAHEFTFTRDDTDSDRLVRFPSENLSELDLNALLRPTGQSQGPTLRNAITSLRMARLLLADPEKFTQSDTDDTGACKIEIKRNQQTLGFVHVQGNGSVLKASQSRAPFGYAQLLLSDQLSSDVCDFDLKVLSNQIGKECLYPSDETGNYGKRSDRQIEYNNTLILRIETLLSSSDMSCFFSNEGRDVCKEITQFLDDPDGHAMVLSFEHVSFKHDARALLLNALGRHLLAMARDGSFRSRPLVCFLDEAHQFIGRSVGDDANSVNLDAFGLIAKEGRKYGLTTTIATQRPRDVPQDVLSQLGTLFVHRLTNDRDRETIERSCGDLDKSAAAFIPSLSQGEVIVVGPDLPAPLPLMMKRPAKSQQPTSSGPQFQKGWGHQVVERSGGKKP
jgi:uncharacterized protein